jgi:hypothetical protein
MYLTSEQVEEIYSILAMMTNEDARQLSNDSIQMYEQCIKWKNQHLLSNQVV